MGGSASRKSHKQQHRHWNEPSREEEVDEVMGGHDPELIPASTPESIPSRAAKKVQQTYHL